MSSLHHFNQVNQAVVSLWYSFPWGQHFLPVMQVKQVKLKEYYLAHVCVLKGFSRIWLFVTLWMVALQAPLSMEFSRQEYWGGLPCPPPGDLSNPGINLCLQHCRRILYPLSHLGDSLRSHRLYSPWNSPSQNTGVGSLSLLQGIFPTQGSNLGLPHCRRILYQLSHKGSPRILEWVAYPFSSGSSQPRNRTGVSCIAGRFFTNWAHIQHSAWRMFGTNRWWFFISYHHVHPRPSPSVSIPPVPSDSWGAFW